MPSDLAAAGKSAREQILVPELSMETIRRSSHVAAARGRARMIAFCSAVGVSALLVGAGLGEKLYEGVRIWISGGKVGVDVRSFEMIRQPTAPDLHEAIAHATFPIVFPVGVPPRTYVWMAMFAPAGHPNDITVVYRNDRVKFDVGFMLIDTTTLSTDDTTLPGSSARPPFHDVYLWRVGGETVLVPKRSISYQDMNRIKAAMIASSPFASLSTTNKMLSASTVLGGLPTLATFAERYAPLHGHSVVLARQEVRSISGLAKRGAPLMDDRTVYLTNIPSVSGEPDYSKATLRWPKIIAVSAAGVRAIYAVLGAKADCDCAILFNQPNSNEYWIWKLPLSASGSVKKFSVDAKTFAVTST